MNNDLYRKLAEIAGTEHVLQDEPMRRHTTFHIGGPADLLVTPSSEEQLAACIRACRDSKEPWNLIGNGSNLLVADAGVRGVVIKLGRLFSDVSVEGTYIYAQAGAMLSSVAAAALKEELTGFEFAAGIPGTIGGAAVMNAGAYGGELKDVVRFVRVLCTDGTVRDVPCSEMAFGYRTSAVAAQQYIVMGVGLDLQKGSGEEIAACMADLKTRRVSKQPLDKPSAGSTFKRPEGYFAGKLIMDAGFAGYSVGDAMVSPKHCGFVVNNGEAAAADIWQLIKDVQAGVLEKFGVQLETEVKCLGEFA